MSPSHGGLELMLTHLSGARKEPWDRDCPSGSEETWPQQHLDLGLLASRAVGQLSAVLSTQFVGLYYNSPANES